LVQACKVFANTLQGVCKVYARFVPTLFSKANLMQNQILGEAKNTPYLCIAIEKQTV